jgi:hypothetical protein
MDCFTAVAISPSPVFTPPLTAVIKVVQMHITDFLYNLRSSNNGSSRFDTEGHRDKLMFESEMTRSVQDTQERAGRRPKFTFEVDVTCGRGTLARSFEAEALRLYDNDEAFEQSHISN